MLQLSIIRVQMTAAPSADGPAFGLDEELSTKGEIIRLNYLRVPPSYVSNNHRVGSLMAGFEDKSRQEEDKKGKYTSTSKSGTEWPIHKRRHTSKEMKLRKWFPSNTFPSLGAPVVCRGSAVRQGSSSGISSKSWHWCKLSHIKRKKSSFQEYHILSLNS